MTPVWPHWASSAGTQGHHWGTEAGSAKPPTVPAWVANDEAPGMNAKSLGCFFSWAHVLSVAERTEKGEVPHALWWGWGALIISAPVMNADGRVWGLWYRISKSEKLAVALWLSRAPFKHGDEKGWGRYRWRQPEETWFYLTVQLMTFPVRKSPGGPWPPTSSTPSLRMHQSHPAPASTSASTPCTMAYSWQNEFCLKGT